MNKPEDLMDDNQVRALVSGIAIEFKRRFYRYVELEDITQELWIWIVKHPGKTERWLEEENGLRSLERALKNAALNFCQQQKAIDLGYSVTDLVYWDQGNIKDMLPAIFDDDQWVHGPVNEPENGRRSRGEHGEGGNWVASLVDLSRAYDTLPMLDQILIHERFASEVPVKKMAEEHDVSPKTIYDRLDRAVNRLHRNLGGRRPHKCSPTCECVDSYSRKSIGNAEAMARLEKHYDEQ